jgi:hypothetical protein
VRRGELFAELIEDCRNRPPIVHCVVQRLGSPGILFLGQFQSRSEAESAAEQFISDYLKVDGVSRSQSAA